MFLFVNLLTYYYYSRKIKLREYLKKIIIKSNKQTKNMNEY